MPLDALRKQWDARAAGAPLHCTMTFEGDDLVLGAGTRLATVERGPRRVDKHAVLADDARLVAMLSAAYRRPIGASVLGYIRCALVKRGEGETAVALTHLALTGLPKLALPEEDARTLFMADGLVEAGVDPRMILRALDLDESPLEELERRYNPDQPRVPAGNGDESGQWTAGANGAAGSSSRSGRPDARRQYAQNAVSDAERFPTEPESESEPVTFYNPETRQYIRFPANSALEPRAPPGFINLNNLPRGQTYFQAPPGEAEPPPGNPPPKDETPGEVDDPIPQDIVQTATDKAKARAAQLARNKAAGAKWEDDLDDEYCQQPLPYARQITLVTASGRIYRVDFLFWNPATGEYSGKEAKASDNATFSGSQREATEEIARTGARIAGVGKPGFPGGTYLPPFKIEIVRPQSEKFMTIEQQNVIDFVFPEDRDGNTSLIISDHLPWDTDETEHWYMLQEKVNHYLPFILDGQLRKEFPASKGRKAIIVIVAKYALNDASRAFVEKLAGHTRKYAIDLRFHQYIPGVNEAY
jgi:hypothetical protein